MRACIAGEGASRGAQNRADHTSPCIAQCDSSASPFRKASGNKYRYVSVPLAPVFSPPLIRQFLISFPSALAGSLCPRRLNGSLDALQLPQVDHDTLVPPDGSRSCIFRVGGVGTGHAESDGRWSREWRARAWECEQEGLDEGRVERFKPQVV